MTTKTNHGCNRQKVAKNTSKNFLNVPCANCKKRVIDINKDYAESFRLRSYDPLAPFHHLAVFEIKCPHCGHIQTIDITPLKTK